MKDFCLQLATRLWAWIKANPKKAASIGGAIAAFFGLPYIPPELWSLIGAVLGAN